MCSHLFVGHGEGDCSACISLESSKEHEGSLAHFGGCKEGEVVRMQWCAKLIRRCAVGAVCRGGEGECEVGVGWFALLLEERLPMSSVDRVVLKKAFSMSQLGGSNVEVGGD